MNNEDMLPFWLLAGVFALAVEGLALGVSFFVAPLAGVVEGVTDSTIIYHPCFSSETSLYFSLFTSRNNSQIK